MKSLLTAILLLCTITLFSQSKTDDLSLLTKTEWVNKNLDYLKFDVDTVFYNLADKKHQLYYDLNKRILTLEERYSVGGIDKRKEGVRFKIRSLEKDKLVIYPLDDKINLDQENFLKLDYSPFFKRKEFIFYNREKVVSSVDFKKITFHGSTCFGTCPSFSLEINRDGSVFYQGRIYTKEFTGNFEGVLNKKELYEFHKLLNRSQLPSIDQYWKQTTRPVDTPRYNYLIELKNGEVIEINTNDQHPVLDKLSNYFLNVPELAELQKAQTKHAFEKPNVDPFQLVSTEE